MRERLELRRAELAAELDRGERMLSEMRSRQEDLRTDLLRISGALQLLDELLEPGTESATSERALHRVGAG